MLASFLTLGKRRRQIRLSGLTPDKFTNREVNSTINNQGTQVFYFFLNFGHFWAGPGGRLYSPAEDFLPEVSGNTGLIKGKLAH